nr:polyprotein [Blackberry dwarf-associated virus]
MSGDPGNRFSVLDDLVGAPTNSFLTLLDPKRPSESKYIRQPDIFSSSSTGRVTKSEQARAQQAPKKTSLVAEKGKRHLKQQGGKVQSEPKQLSNRQRTYLYRKTGALVTTLTKIPEVQSSPSVSSRKTSPSTSSTSSRASYHSSVSTGPSFKREKPYTPLSSVKSLHEVTYFPGSSKTTSQSVSRNGPADQAARQQVHHQAKMSAPQKPKSASSGPLDKGKAVKSGGSTASSSSSTSPVHSKQVHQNRREGGSGSKADFSRRNSGWGPRVNTSEKRIPERFSLDFTSLRTCEDLAQISFFPSELSLKQQERLADFLDVENFRASEFIISFVRSMIEKDAVKTLPHNFFISKRGNVHFFNAEGTYCGAVGGDIPTWFYGRAAGNSKSEYLSIGQGKTSRCYIKTRFPTLIEFILCDWAAGKSSLKNVTVFGPKGNRNWRGEPGFCWLPLYLKSTLPLSAYPTAGLVRLFTLQDHFGLVPIVKSGKYYHYDPNGKKHKKFPNVFVGAEETSLRLEPTTWTDCINDPMLRTAVDSVMRKTVLKDSSSFQNNIDELFDRALKQTMDTVRTEKFKVSQHLTTEEFDNLRSYFGLSYIENGTSPRNPHSLLNAMRECFNKTYHRSFRGVTVSDIGGNIATAVLNDYSNYHVCLPLVDSKDAARQTRSVISLYNSLDFKQNMQDKVLSRLHTLKNITHCSNKVPTCHHKSSVIVMVDVYDVSLIALVEAMSLKGSLLARLCFMFPPELVNETGVITHKGTGVTVVRDGDILTYHIADASDSYTHVATNVLSYLNTSSIRAKSGLTYSVELVNQNGPYLDFQVSVCSASSSSKTKRSMRGWNANMSEISVMCLDAYGIPRTIPVFLDRDFVRRALSHSANVCNTVDDRTYEYVLSNIRSQTTMMIVGSKIVHNKVELSNDILIELPGAILRESVRRRKNTVQMAKREMQSPFMKLLSKILSVPKLIISKLLSLIKKILPKSFSKVFDEIIKTESGIKDCADVIVIETTTAPSDIILRNEMMSDVLEAVKRLTVLTAPEISKEDNEIEQSPDVKFPETNEEDVAEEIRRLRRKHRGGLNGAGGNWYDFLLPKTADKDTGDSIWASLWRAVRKLDRLVKGNRAFSMITSILSIILTALMKVFSAGWTAVSNQTFGAEKLKKKPVDLRESAVNSLRFFSEKLLAIISWMSKSNFCSSVKEVSGAISESLKEKVTDFGTNCDRSIKCKIASCMKLLGLKYPKGWLDERGKLHVLLDAAVETVKRLNPVLAVAGTSLLLLLSSEVRKLLKTASCKTLAFIKRIRLQRPCVIASTLLGFFLGNLSSLSFLSQFLTKGNEMSLGLMNSSILTQAFYSLKSGQVQGPGVFMLKFFMYLKSLELATSVFSIVNTPSSEEQVIDVANVQPVLSSFSICPEAEEVIARFRENIERDFGPKTVSNSQVGETSKVEPKKAVVPKPAKAEERVDGSPERVEKSSPRAGIIFEGVERNSDSGVKPVHAVATIALGRSSSGPFSQEELDVVETFLNNTFIEEGQKEAKDIDSDVLPVPNSLPPTEVIPIKPSDLVPTKLPQKNKLSCGCGVSLNIEHFTQPCPLPLMDGDSLPGRECWFFSRGGEAYSYTGASHQSRGWCRELDLHIEACKLEPNMFDHCLVQRYRPNSGIPYHRDNESVYPADVPILTINVYGTADFSVDCRKSSGTFRLTESCYFLMPEGFQVTHRHSVNCKTHRLSMTFRATKRHRLGSKVDRELLSVPNDNSGNSSPTYAPDADFETEKQLSLRPQSTLNLSGKPATQAGDVVSPAHIILGMKIDSVFTFLNKNSYKTLKCSVRVSGNLGCVLEAFAYNLHELYNELHTLTKAVEQPEILVGKRKECFMSSIPDLDRVRVCKYPELVKTSGIDSLYAGTATRKLYFSCDENIIAEDSVLALSPIGISFPLKRVVGMYRMFLKLTPASLERALIGCTFINAVPGAGKTHEIKQLIQAFSTSPVEGENLLVLTASKNSAESLQRYTWEHNISNMIMVMTVDSFIFSFERFKNKQFCKVLIDECYMIHAGLAILIAAITNPAELRLYGDRRQVPFINRNVRFQDTKSKLNSDSGKYTEKLVTYRCPADICYWMSNVDFERKGSRLYSGKVTSAAENGPLKSVKSHPFSPNELQFLKSVDRVMTFTQMEKADLINKFLSLKLGTKDEAEDLIGTVAESQGETYGRVALVRSKAADDSVFSSIAHRLVALTRHTQSLDFFCLPSKMSKGIGADVLQIEKLESSVARTFVVQHCV